MLSDTKLSETPQWVALYTKPRAEKKVVETLSSHDYECYLPLRKELHDWSDRKKWIEVPLIKSYVFVKICKGESSKVLAFDNVVAMIAFNGVIAVIPDAEIQMMKDFIASEFQVQVEAMDKLRRGVKVRINSGGLEGREGMLVSDCVDGNFAVEITGISMAMIINVDRELLDVVSDEEQPKPVRKKKKYNLR